MSADERRDAVVALARHAFAEGGLRGTSTETIAAAAGISQPYLFRLFPTKVDLFLAAVDACFDRVSATFAEAAEGLSGEAALTAMGDVYTALIDEEPDLLRLQLHAYAAAAAERGDIQRRVRARFLALMSEVQAIAGTDEPPLEFFAMGMLCNVVTAVAGPGPDLKNFLALVEHQRP